MVGLVYWFIYLRPSWTHHPEQRDPQDTAVKKA
jgi:hypothetical protein